MIYASTATDVNGYVLLHLELSETNPSQVLLNKIYVSSHTERRPKLSSDSSETRARVAREAFKDAMSKFKADLNTLPGNAVP